MLSNCIKIKFMHRARPSRGPCLVNIAALLSAGRFASAGEMVRLGCSIGAEENSDLTQRCRLLIKSLDDSSLKNSFTTAQR